MGYPVALNKVKLPTHSVVYNLIHGVSYFSIMKLPGTTYEHMRYIML